VTQQDRTPLTQPVVFLVILLFVAAALRTAIAFCDVRTLVTKVISDDSFYYFQLARNAAQGNGITFDGVVPANGFHPLWLLALIPFQLLFKSSLTAPIHAALVFEGLLDVGAGLFIYLLVRRLTDNRGAALLGAAIYLLNPSVIFHSVNGLETGLNLFLFAFYFWFYLSMLHDDKITTRRLILLGFLSGLLMLARTDNTIVVAMVYLHLLFFRKAIRKPGSIAASAAAGTLLVAPWLLWNLHTFGTIAQSSGGAYSIITRGNLRASGVTQLQIFLTSLSNTIKLFVWTIPTDVFAWGGLMGIAAGLTVGLTLLDDFRAHKIWKALRLACVPLAAFVALALAHSLVRGTLKSWYFIPAATVASLIIGILCGPYSFRTLARRGRTAVAVALLIAVIFGGYLLNGWTGWQKGMYPWQSEQALAAEWSKEHVAQTQWIGSFNSGIIGYLSERHVVNLDGLVNNSVIPYLKERRLWDYICERNISYLIDSDYSIMKDYRDFYGAGWEPREHLIRVAVIDDPAVSWAGAPVVVYRIIP
jgi:hypothetical protein